MRKIDSGASGLRAAQLVDDERRQQHERAGELGDRARGAPADGRRAARARRRAAASRRWPAAPRARRSRAAAAGAASGAISAQDAGEHEHDRDRVDEHHPAPAQALRSAGRRAARRPPTPDRRRRPRRRAPRGGPTARVNVVVRIESAAGSIIAAPMPCASRAPTSTPLLFASPPISDEIADHDRAGDQHPPAADQVGGPAAEQHEAAVGEQVAARDPLQALL